MQTSEKGRKQMMIMMSIYAPILAKSHFIQDKSCISTYLPLDKYTESLLNPV